MDIERWAWAGQERYPGFCLSFVRDREPAAVAAALGAGSTAVMTLAEAEQAHPISERGALLRLGDRGPWTFCFEDRAPIANRAPAIARLSQDTRLLQVTKSGDGMVIVRDVVDGRKVEMFEPGTAPRAGASLHPRIAALAGKHPAIVAALAVVGDEAGVDLDRDTLEGPLATAWSTLNEPAVRR
ncbi:DUF6461 domain-containing protein [Actinoplanes sp. NPDC049316]|uniref:DUF6461 domain-containing protein n=1 Tax=Actinoplanes sp. NPDC049316 TaxID=3154727 RepID=UPI0034318663